MRTCMGVAATSLAIALVVGYSTVGAPQAKAPHDPPVIDAQGYARIVQQHRGKPLLITLWATWCEPCRDEYPMLNELAKEYEPKGLQVVGINYDQEGDLILMRRFIARYKPIFPNFRKKQGDEAEFTQAVMPGWSGALPASVFYNKYGKQVNHVLGAGSHETYENAIRQLLAEDSASR